jgi:hypothetical protein
VFVAISHFCSSLIFVSKYTPYQGSLIEGEGSVHFAGANKYITAPFCNENIIFTFYKTHYLNEEVNCTEPALLVRIPWSSPLVLYYAPWKWPTLKNALAY